MSIKINVNNVEGNNQKMVSMEMVGWGYKSSLSVKLIGSTVVIPINIPVQTLSIEFPDGLHSMAFDFFEKGPFECGSGHTTYLDGKDRFSLELLLTWWDNGKLLVKAVENMSGNELSKFNHFIKSGTGITVLDGEKKTVYFLGQLSEERDSGWTYKSVSGNDILKYITKRMTMEELDTLVTLTQAKRDELYDLKCEMVECATELVDLKNENKKLKDGVSDLIIGNDALYKLIASSKSTLIGISCVMANNKLSINQFVSLGEKFGWLYNLLKYLPIWLQPQPKAVDRSMLENTLIHQSGIDPNKSLVDQIKQLI